MASIGECQNPRDGYSSKAVSCADGVTVAHSFTTNDCTTVVDVQTVPASGECLELEGGGATTVECTANGVTQKV